MSLEISKSLTRTSNAQRFAVHEYPSRIEIFTRLLHTENKIPLLIIASERGQTINHSYVRSLSILKKYTFHLIHSSIPYFQEKDHVIPAHSLTDAIQKFTRKHQLEVPAYWDEPFFDTFIELIFKGDNGSVTYKIHW